MAGNKPQMPAVNCHWCCADFEVGCASHCYSEFPHSAPVSAAHIPLSDLESCQVESSREAFDANQQA